MSCKRCLTGPPTAASRRPWRSRVPFFLLSFLLGGLAVPLGAAQSAGGTAEPSPQQLLEQAVALQQQGRAAEAVGIYERLVNMGYRHPDLLTNFGAAYAAAGNLAKAIAVYEEAKLLGGDSVVLHFNLGLAYYKSGQAEAALRELDRALQLEPQLKQARLLIADLYFQQGEPQQVVDLLMPLAPESRNDPAVAYLLGTALLQLGREIEGQTYVDAVMRQPNSAPAHVMLATAHLRAGRLDDAVAEIERAIAAAPDLPGSHAILGRILLEQNDVERARQAFQRELELNPNSYDACFHLGALKKDEGEYEEAVPLLERALQLRPGSAEALYQLGEVYVRADRLEQARKTLEQLVEQQPRFTKAHAQLAVVYHRLGLRELADRERQIVVRLTAEEEAQKPKQRRTLFGSPSLEEIQRKQREQEGPPSRPGG
ncbi:MAG: hypothetical protein Kow00109_10540 [Acidobacteriota bacterium]